MTQITLQEVEQSLPAHLKSAASQSLVDKINGISGDPDVARTVRENFISYSGVLRDGRFKTEDYVNAVAYVSFKLMGYNNKEAYQRTFPNRYQALVLRGASEKEISSYVAAYNKNKLVNLIFEQTLIPAWVLNQDVYQKAIEQQAYLMMHAKSEKVQSDAANSLLTHLKKPETKQVELSLGIKEEASGMEDLKAMLTGLAQRQQDLIAQGVPTREIAHQKLGQDLPSSNSSHTAPHHTTQIEGTMKDVTPKKENP